jgi:hypothetical protein
MKVHLIQSEVLLLQGVGDGGKFIGEQRAQIPFFAPNHNSNVVGMNGGADFHVPERRRVHPDSHFRLSRLTDHLRHLDRSGDGIGRRVYGWRKLRGRVEEVRRSAVLRFMRGRGRGEISRRRLYRSLN